MKFKLLDTIACNHNNENDESRQLALNELLPDPLCTECVDVLVQLLDDEIEQLTSDVIAYEQQLSMEWDNRPHRSEEEEAMEESKYLQELDRLQNEEMKLRENYALLLSEKIKLSHDSAKSEEKKQTIEMKESRYWKLFYANLDSYDEIVGANESMNRTVKYMELECKRLQSVGPEATIDIWYEGEFGTINGLKLGRTHHVKVEWEEINAAWGLCCLLLHILANQKKFTFSMYRLIPDASSSKIEDIEDGKKYGLFYTSARNLALFNKAVRCFLSCVNEFCIHAESKRSPTATQSLKRYEISEETGRIGGLSVEYSLEDETSWTKALKHLLINLKYLQKS
jgi:beclin 1